METIACKSDWVLSGAEADMKPLIDYFYREDGECPEDAYYELSDPGDEEDEEPRELIIHLRSHHLPFLAKILAILERGGGKAALLSVYLRPPGDATRAHAWINGAKAEAAEGPFE